MVQWLGLGAFIVVAPGSIPDRGTKILQATRRGKKKLQEKPITVENFNISLSEKL